MFYLRINKIKFLNNRELLGKAEIQFLSFVNAGENDFPMLKDFFNTNNEHKKNELIEHAISKVIGSRNMLPVQKIKNKQDIYFGDTGYIIFKSNKIPPDLNWMLLAIELDDKTRKNAELVDKIATKSNITKVVSSIATLSSLTNPVSGAITTLSKFVAGALVEVYTNKKDDQAGLLLTSFIEREHYPHGIRDGKGVKDLSGNMFIDYSIFAYNE